MKKDGLLTNVAGSVDIHMQKKIIDKLHFIRNKVSDVKDTINSMRRQDTEGENICKRHI